MRNLTPEQIEATRLSDTATAVIAAAGSGKTTVLVERYLNCLAKGIAPSEILTLTFTNEAADQMKERILERLSDLPFSSDKLRENVSNSRQIGTLHSFCYRVLNQFGSHIGREFISSILTPYELASRFERAYREWIEFIPEHSFAFFLSHFSLAEFKELVRSGFKNRFAFREALRLQKRTQSRYPEEGSQIPLDHEILDRFTSLVAPLYKRLQSEFLKEGCYSFDELEEYTLEILTKSAGARNALQAQYRTVLVDEFQDTSPIQWKILKQVLGENREKLFVVGDPKQSIYRFRHADVKLFQEVCDEIQTAQGSIIRLNTNFRTDPSLLTALNQIGHHIFSESPFPFEDMTTLQSSSGQAEFKIIRYDIDRRGDIAEIEPKFLADHIEASLKGGEKPGDFAILFRVADRIPEYEKELRGRGLPTFCQATQPLLQFYDVMDLVSYLKAIENPLENHALAAFLRTPYAGFSYQDLANLQDKEGKTLYEKLLKTPGSLQWFFALIEKGECDFEKLITELFRNTKYWPEKSETLLHLLSALGGSCLKVSEALSKIESWQNEGIPFQNQVGIDNDSAIRLMTVHAAKGLEFHHVCLVDNLRQSPNFTPPLRFAPESLPGLRYRVDNEAICNNSYELQKKREQIEDREESKRILYVAVTRAEKKLTAFLPKEDTLIPKQSWAALIRDSF